MKTRARACLIGSLLTFLGCADSWAGDAPSSSPQFKVETVDVAPAWSAQLANFALLTHGDQQFVAFYDDQRRMTLAQRTLGQANWKFKVLPSTLGWDSHNYVTMTLDSANCLHVSGNMHAVPLVYFRATKPLDIDSVVPVKQMTGQNESSVTYPIFLHGPSGELIFSYRDGRSGDGDNLFNIYDPATQTWRRLIDAPLMDGQGKRNAYMIGPNLGPDGYYHVSWVWRDSYDVATCHDLSYMRSRDLVHWETVEGKPLTLPITMATPGVIVDPIPVHGGIVNGMGRVGFDANNRVIISYPKYDAHGITQLYLATYENGAWKSVQGSDWKRRFEFSGGGTVPDYGFYIGTPKMRSNQLTISITHRDYAKANWILDPQTLHLLSPAPVDPRGKALWPLSKPESTFPGMQVHWSDDLGSTTTDDAAPFHLRWESLPPNRDQPRQPPLPPAATLRVVSVTNS